MSRTIKIKDSETGTVIEMDFDPESKIEEIIISAADYWNKKPGAYLIKLDNTILPGSKTISDAGFGPDDELELLPDPEGG